MFWRGEKKRKKESVQLYTINVLRLRTQDMQSYVYVCLRLSLIFILMDQYIFLLLFGSPFSFLFQFPTPFLRTHIYIHSNFPFPRGLPCTALLFFLYNNYFSCVLITYGWCVYHWLCGATMDATYLKNI